MSILCIYAVRVVPNAASCRLALDCASCTIAPFVGYAHPRTSKYLPYVSKYTIKTALAIYISKTTALGVTTDRFLVSNIQFCHSEICQSPRLMQCFLDCILLTCNLSIVIYNVVILKRILRIYCIPVVAHNTEILELNIANQKPIGRHPRRSGF